MCHTGLPHGTSDGPAVREEVLGLSMPDGVEFPTFVAFPDEPGPVVLVIADMYGRSLFYEELSRRLARRGYTAVCPEIFARQGPLPEQTPDQARARWATMDEARLVGELSMIIDLARGLPGAVADGPSGTLGCCLGGTLALNLAASRTDLATVCFYGFPTGSRVARQYGPAPLDEVTSFAGPLLGLWGEEDASVGIPNIHAYAAALGAAGHEPEFTIYPGVGHGFMAASGREPDDAHLATIAGDAWQKAVAFLDKALRPGSTVHA